MVAPLTIAIVLTEMPIEGAIFRKGASVMVRTILEVGVLTYLSDSTTLYQNCINIPRLLRQDLVTYNVSLYKGDIIARKY
jgi:hypothetical protein